MLFGFCALYTHDVVGVSPKYGLLALIGLGSSGWYQVLQGQAFSRLPGKSATVVAPNAVGVQTREPYEGHKRPIWWKGKMPLRTKPKK